MNFDDYISIGEFAKRLGVHVQTVRRWIYSGSIPSDRVVKVGGRWYIHRDILNRSLKDEQIRSLLSLPNVDPKKLYKVYSLLLSGTSLDGISEKLQLSKKRIYDYVRFLVRIGLVEKTNGIYKATKNFDGFYEFLFEISRLLEDVFSDLLQKLNGKPLNYEALARDFSKEGYDVSPSKIRTIISVLKKFRLLVPSRRISIINGGELGNRIINFLRSNGGLSTFGSIQKFFGNDESIINAMRELIRDRKIIIRTIPREFILIAKAIAKTKNINVEEVYTPISAAAKLDEVARALAEIMNMDYESASQLIRIATKLRPDLLRIKRDRPRPEYGSSEPPEIVMMMGPLSPKDILELVED